MNKKTKHFGTDGIRGVAGKSPLDPESLVRLGKAVAAIFLKDTGMHRILIGKDTRLSGYMIETSLCAGITSMGANALMLGPLPTPGTAYLTKSMRADAGIMISASHNPYEDNGIKIFAADGFKLPDKTEQEIETLMEPGQLEGKEAEPGKIGKAIRIDDAVGRYTVELKNCFPRDLSLEGVKTGFDCANGAGYIVGPQTFEELGATVITRGAKPNGKNINAGFGSLYPEVVRELVIEQQLDIGIALDGDADRLILVDEKGNIIDGDAILAICAMDLDEQGKLPGKKVVGTVMSNLGLEKTLEKYGIQVERAAVGDRHVLEKMKEENIPLGGEQSGHTIFLEHSTTGDGILAALMVLAAMKRKEKPLSELVKSFISFPQRLINIKVREKPELSSLEPVQKAIKSAEEHLGEKGRLLVRYSGTEMKARVMVEAEDETLCSSQAEKVAEVIEAQIGTL